MIVVEKWGYRTSAAPARTGAAQFPRTPSHDRNRVTCSVNNDCLYVPSGRRYHVAFMGESTRSFASSRVAGNGIIYEPDPWRRRMRRAAERLRSLDQERFGAQIERIETCLRTDAEWNLKAALTSCERWAASY